MSDKTIVFLGSSVTCGGDGYSMVEYVRENTDYTCIKWAISGTTLADIEEMSYVSRMKKEMATQDECDLLITQLSTNDASKGLPLGEIAPSFDKETFDTKTITGAMEYIVATAKKKWDCPVAFYTGTKFDKPAYQAMVDRLYELKDKWGIDVIDLWNDEEMNSVSSEDYEKYMNPDGVHPKREGYELWWGPKFKKYVEEKLK